MAQNRIVRFFDMLARSAEKSAGLQAKEQAFWPVATGPLNGMHHDLLPRAHYNYARDVGEGLDSNVIMSPILWIARTFTEARAVVQARKARGVWEESVDHELEALIE